MATDRTRHWTDIPHPSLSGKRQRKIGNHLNYVSPGGILLPTQVAVSVAPGAPPNWSGQFDFRDQSIEAPLQFFAHDTTDPDNRAMVGVRIDDTPDVWINIKADGVQTGIETQTVDDITREWPGLWTNSTLRWIHGGHKAVKEIVLSAPGHPDYFDFLLRHSPGSTLEIANDVFIVRDAQGNSKIESQAPHGFDDSADEAGLGAKYIRCTLTDMGTEGPGGVYHRVRLTPNADDLSGAVYPVTLDPTATISGSTYIDDQYLNASNSNNNYGAAEVLSSRWTSTIPINRTVIRLAASQIPAGTITDLTYNFTTFFNTAGGCTLLFYRVATANYALIEGTATGAPQTGSPCWANRAYDASSPTAWASGGVFGSSTSDYDADATPPSYTVSANGSHSASLGTDGADWCVTWRDTANTNGGIFIEATPNSNTQASTRSVQYATSGDRPTFDITYTVSSGQPTWIRWTPIHVAGRNALFRGSF